MTAAPDKKRWPRAVACEAARELCVLLQPVTHRLIVAGSLRRRKQEVGDVEILFIPKFAADTGDLFESKLVNQADRELQCCLDKGVLTKRLSKTGGTAWGGQIKLAIHAATGVGVDLFTATEESWWNYLVCRTGPKASNERIAMEAQRRGWKWKPYTCGFCKLEEGEETGEFHAVQSERDVFEFVGLPYAEPWERA